MYGTKVKSGVVLICCKINKIIDLKEGEDAQVNDFLKVIIYEELKKAHTDFIIYPFGVIGKQVKKILNEDFKISENLILDDMLQQDEVFPVQYLQNYEMKENEYIILATVKQELYYEKKKLAEKYSKYPQNIISLFDYSEDNLKMWLMEKGGFDFKECIYKLWRGGVKFYLPFWRTDSIQNWIILNDRFYEDKYLNAIYVQFGKWIYAKAILDIGANIGNHSLFFATVMHPEKVYSFEPIKETYDILQTNIKINGLSNIIIPFNVACGAEAARGKRQNYNYDNIGGTSILECQDGEFDVCTIDSMKINDDIALIKIDVEGFEEKVILGSLQTIKTNKPIIMVEAFDEADTFWSIYRILSDLGYKCRPFQDKDYVFYLDMHL